MKHTTSLSAFAALTLLLPASTTAAREPLADRISLELEKASAREVFASLEQMIGLPVDSSCEGAVTIRLENVSVRTALTALTESLGCAWQVEAGRIVVRDGGTPPPETKVRVNLAPNFAEPISLRLREARLIEVLQAATALLGVGLEVDDALQAGSLSIDVEALPVEAALDRICALEGCAWEYRPETRVLVVRRR